MSKLYEPAFAEPKGALIRPYPSTGILMAQGAGVPTASASGYAKGCIYIDTTNGAQYVNTGTVSSATWSIAGVSGATVPSLTITAAVLTTATITNGTITKTTNGIGATTAAAGSTSADAGALPAGTANVYPTTAADGTKGVVLSASDNVTGRTIMIGNGVSNAILKVYPPAGGTINGASANAAFSSVSGKGVIVVCLDSTANSGAGSFLAW